MGAFFDKFKILTSGSFDFLRLSAVNVLINSVTAEFCFVCPEALFEDTQKRVDEIREAVEKAYPTSLKVSVKLSKSHFDPHFFTQDLNKFFDFYASLRGCVKKRNVECSTLEDGTHSVKILLKSSAFQAFSARGLLRELLSFVESNYCEKIEISVAESDEVEEFFDETTGYTYDYEFGRHIPVTNAEGLVGFTVYDLPSYICDADVCEKAVICGKIEALKELPRKPKDGKEKPNFFKFMLNDSTGVINCVFFPNERTRPAMMLLKEGDEIIVDGKIESNNFNDTTTITHFVRRISRCSLPADFKINRLKLDVPARYKNVFPKRFEEYRQEDFFSAAVDDEPDLLALSGENAELAQEKSSEFTEADQPSHKTKDILNDNVFCVFDIETTGLDRLNDKIIEIGAVKIENGVITETFSTFVDPQIRVPERITKLTGITDADLKNAFLLEEVLPDLLKFFDGTVLVGHNIDFFDYPFLSHAAAKHNIYFDNKRLDTYSLAREHIKMPQYKLKDLAARYGIINPNAHRALDDAVTTAKALLAMIEEFEIIIP